MRNYSVRFWGFLCALLVAFLFIGCDTERLEYEDEDSYALLDGQYAAAPSAADVQRALHIIDHNYPMGAVSWAYSVIAEVIGVIVDPDDIDPGTLTVSEIAVNLEAAGMQFGEANAEDVVIGILQAVVTAYQTPDFDATGPANTALAALGSSLENRGVTSPEQIGAGTELTHGDVLLLVISTAQPATPGGDNLGDVVDDVLEDNDISTGDLPDLEDFVEDVTNTEVTIPHQGSGAGGSSN